MTEWFCMVDGEQFGPVPEETVTTWISERRVRRDTMLWSEGMGDWMAAGNVAAFNEAFRLVPPPVQSPPPPVGPAAPGAGRARGRLTAAEQQVASKKVAAGILGILLGSWGVHKFYLGYPVPGVIMLLVWLFGLLIVIPSVVIGVIGLVEGIMYLTQSDEQFAKAHVKHGRPWF